MVREGRRSVKMVIVVGLLLVDLAIAGYVGSFIGQYRAERRCTQVVEMLGVQEPHWQALLCEVR